MDASIASILALDGVTNGAVYALLAIATVLLFSVTRVLFLPQGEFVAYGALTLGMFQLGQTPGTVWLLLALTAFSVVTESVALLRRGQDFFSVLRHVRSVAAFPVLISMLSVWAAPKAPPLWVQALLTLGLVTPLGGMIWRIAFRPLADASVLVLLIVSVGVHFMLTGLALVFFGAEGYRNPAFWDERYSLGALTLSGQTVIMLAASAALIGLLWLFFERSLYGKALRATAVNRLGARIVGISTETAGRSAFLLAAFIGALSGLLVGPTTTIFYDSGFLIGLKGFVAAVFGGLASYPMAALGAVLLGMVESFGAFQASAFKEVIVFTAILPVLLWRSLRHPDHEEH